MASGRQTRRNTDVAESHADEMDPWKDDRCRDFTCLNVARRLLEFHTGVPAGRSMDGRYVANAERLPQLDCLVGCKDKCAQNGGTCVLAEVFTSVFGEAPLDHAHATHAPRDTGSALSPPPLPTIKTEDAAGPQQQQMPATAVPQPRRNPACCHDCTLYMANYFLDLLARGVVLDRLNVRELTFAVWALAQKGGIHDAGGPTSGPSAQRGHKELLIINLRSAYYELLKRPKLEPGEPGGSSSSSPLVAEKPPAAAAAAVSSTGAAAAAAAAPAVSAPSVPPTAQGRGATPVKATAPSMPLSLHATPGTGGALGGAAVVRTRRSLKADEENHKRQREHFDSFLKGPLEAMVAEVDESLASGALVPPQLQPMPFAQRCLVVLAAARLLDPVIRSGRSTGVDVRPYVTYTAASHPFDYWAAPAAPAPPFDDSGTPHNMLSSPQAIGDPHK